MGPGCGNVTLQGSCAGNVLTFCDPAEGLVRMVDCAATSRVCDEVSASWGFDCVQPVGTECLSDQGAAFCAGTNPACLLAPNPATGQVSVCRDNVGACTPSPTFAPVCLNGTTLAAACNEGQAAGYDCVAVGGTGCAAGVCVGISEGNPCSALTQCAAGLTCQADAQGNNRCTAGGTSSSSSGGMTSSSGGGSSSGGTMGCGNVTLEGECNGSVLSYCNTATNTLVSVNCANTGFTCGLVNPSWGYDCVAPTGNVCLFDDGMGGSQQVFCAGTNPGCVVREDATGDATTACQSNVGTCTEATFEPACNGANLLNVSCLSSQPLTYDCQSLGGTGCSNGTCVGVTAGNLCDAFLVCAAGLTCQADAQGVDRCTAPTTGCGNVTSEGTCTNNVITYCAADMTVQTLDCGAAMLQCASFPSPLGFDCAASVGSRCYVSDGTTARQLMCLGADAACVVVPAVGQAGQVDTVCRSSVGACTPPTGTDPFVPVCASATVLHVDCRFGQGLSYDCAALGGTGCSNGVCVGATVGSPCDPFIQCASGLSCVTSSPDSAGTCQVPTGDQDLATVRATADGNVLPLPVNDVVVTYVKPLIGSATNDPAGFTVQASREGPAIFVAVDPATLNPVPVAGDRVTFFVTTVATVGGQKRVTALTGYSRTAQGVALMPLTQNLSTTADLVTNLGNYESELVTVTGTLTSAFAASGTGHVAANLDTAGVMGNSNLRLRIPETLAATLGARSGCTVAVTGTPLWRFNAVAQVSAWTAAEIAVSNCPAASGAQLVINELNANVTNGCDLIELRVAVGGNLQNFTLLERVTTLVTFPAMTVAKNDIIVVHMGAGSATCNPMASTTETTGPNANSATGNFANAWDVWSNDTGLTNTDNTFRVVDAAGTLQDAVLVADSEAGMAAQDSETAAGLAAAAGQWQVVGGGTPPGGFMDDAFRVNAVQDLNATATSATGTSIQRTTNVDSNDRAGWTTGAGAAQTFGALNMGQTAFP